MFLGSWAKKKKKIEKKKINVCLKAILLFSLCHSVVTETFMKKFCNYDWPFVKSVIRDEKLLTLQALIVFELSCLILHKLMNPTGNGSFWKNSRILRVNWLSFSDVLVIISDSPPLATTFPYYMWISSASVYAT